MSEGQMTRQEFPENVQLRGPRGVRAAVCAVARRKHSTPSEIMRQYIIRGLEEDGATIEPIGAAEAAR